MPEAADLVAAADTLEEASLFKEAIATYTKAIELSPTAPSYYIKRYFAPCRYMSLAKLIPVQPRISAPVISTQLLAYFSLS
jgi:hypothetical protein